MRTPSAWRTWREGGVECARRVEITARSHYAFRRTGRVSYPVWECFYVRYWFEGWYQECDFWTGVHLRWRVTTRPLHFRRPFFLSLDSIIVLPQKQPWMICNCLFKCAMYWKLTCWNFIVVINDWIGFIWIIHLFSFLDMSWKLWFLS